MPACLGSLTIVACDRASAGHTLRQLHDEWSALRTGAGEPADRDEGHRLLALLGGNAVALVTWFSDPMLLEAAPHATLGHLTHRTALRPIDMGEGQGDLYDLLGPGSRSERPLVAIIEASLHPLVTLSAPTPRPATLERIVKRARMAIARHAPDAEVAVASGADSSALFFLLRASSFGVLAAAGHAIRVARWGAGDGPPLDGHRLEGLCRRTAPPSAAEVEAVHLFRATHTHVALVVDPLSSSGTEPDSADIEGGGTGWTLSELRNMDGATVLAPEASIEERRGFAPWEAGLSDGTRASHQSSDTSQPWYPFGPVQITRWQHGPGQELTVADLRRAAAGGSGPAGVHAHKALSIAPPMVVTNHGAVDVLSREFARTLERARRAAAASPLPWIAPAFALTLPLALERRLGELLDTVGARLCHDAEVYSVALPAIEDLLAGGDRPARVYRPMIAGIGAFIRTHASPDTRPQTPPDGPRTRRMNLGNRLVTDAALGLITDLLLPCGLGDAMPIIIDGLTPLTEAHSVGPHSVLVRLPGAPARLEPMDWSVAPQLSWTGMRNRSYADLRRRADLEVESGPDDERDDISGEASQLVPPWRGPAQSIIHAWKHLGAVVDAGPPEPPDSLRTLLRATQRHIHGTAGGVLADPLGWLLGRLPAMCVGVAALERAAGDDEGPVELDEPERWLHMGPLATRHMLSRRAEKGTSHVDQAVLALLVVVLGERVDRGARGDWTDADGHWSARLDELCGAVLAARDWLQSHPNRLDHPIAGTPRLMHRRLSALCEDTGIGGAALLQGARLVRSTLADNSSQELRRVVDAWIVLAETLTRSWPACFPAQKGARVDKRGEGARALIQYARAAAGRASQGQEPLGLVADPWVPFMQQPPPSFMDDGPESEPSTGPWPSHVLRRGRGEGFIPAHIVLERRGGRIVEDLGTHGDPALWRFLRQAASGAGPPLAPHLIRHLDATLGPAGDRRE